MFSLNFLDKIFSFTAIACNCLRLDLIEINLPLVCILCKIKHNLILRFNHSLNASSFPRITFLWDVHLSYPLDVEYSIKSD